MNVHEVNDLMEKYVAGDMSLSIYAEKDRSRSVAACLINLIQQGTVNPNDDGIFDEVLTSIHLLTDVDEQELIEWAYAVDDPELEFETNQVKG